MPAVRAAKYRENRKTFSLKLFYSWEILRARHVFFYVGHSSNKAIHSVLHKTLAVSRQRAKEIQVWRSFFIQELHLQYFSVFSVFTSLTCLLSCRAETII